MNIAIVDDEPVFLKQLHNRLREMKLPDCEIHEFTSGRDLEPVFTRKIWYNRRAMRYTSDMTDSQWEIIKPILQGAKYRSLEEKREQINAVFYLVKTGCQWRNLPKDFPKWKTVYSFYRRACLNGIWDKIQKALVKKVRLAKGKKETPSYALIDSQSAKTVSSNEKRGYDGGKKRKEEKDT